MFLEYWSEPEATSRSFIGEWFLTGDLGRQDDDGFFFYDGRGDDLIISSGYRIDPYEVEACIRSHPSVSMVSVAGDPDETRTQAVKALVVLETNSAPCDELIRSIQAYVKERLGAHAYPRNISFVDELPLTYSGKVRRTDVRARVPK
jgi:acetyl-CoA synthetase